MDRVWERDERGQVGIGTLIVFISMVLVASIATGVLINTAGFLQSTSEQTGEEAVSGVVDRVQVTAKVGRLPENGGKDYIVIDEDTDTNRSIEGGYDHRLRIPIGEKIRVSPSEDMSLIIDGAASQTYSKNNAVIYRLSRVDGNKIQFKDLTNDDVVNTVSGPVTLETSADADIELSYPSDEIVNPDDEVYFGATLGSETATADFLGAAKLWTANLTVQAGSGAGAIDLADATVVYRSDETLKYLSYAGGSEPNQTAFGVTPFEGGDAVLRENERATVTIDVDGVEGPRHGLPLDEDATVTIITQSTRVTVPLNPPETARGEPYVRL